MRTTRPAWRCSSAPAQTITLSRRPRLDDIVGTRVAFLDGYQNTAYAEQYRHFVERVRAAESPLGSTRLTEAVARYLFKLMAYKDEYEVARLHTDAAFINKIENMFEGDYKVVHHMAPPLLAKKNEKGELVKQAFGSWMRVALRVTAKCKGLRGTAFDPFGYSAERREERGLIAEYRQCVEELMSQLTPEKMALAVEIASLPEEIRGYGHVKARHLSAAREKWDRLMAQWRSGGVIREASRGKVAA